jgi:Protein of unknown function (DUF3455)
MSKSVVEIIFVSCQGQPIKSIEEVTRSFADILPAASMFTTPQNEPRARKQRRHFLRSICLFATYFLPQTYAQTPPGSIDLPKGDAVLMLEAQGKGDQIYGCVEGNWMLIGPDARLFNEQGNVIGRHYAGPTWQLKDGSLVRGKAIATTPPSDAQSVPWLLLKASFGTGEFKAVMFIQRRNTHGGAAPSTTCKGNVKLRVPYTANYLFYEPHISHVGS